jgi:Domain of Unknown Function (DUF1259)
MMIARHLLSLAGVAMVAGCTTLSPTIAHAPNATQLARADVTASDPGWPIIARGLERRGAVKDGVYVITIPRDDLDVVIDGMGIPTAAGLESTFYFYRCPCGKMNVAGQFVTTDYEANDVVDALRKEAAMTVATISPMFVYDRPRLMLIRFQGEGDPVKLAAVIREAIRWTGRERLAPDPNFKIGAGKGKTE